MRNLIVFVFSSCGFHCSASNFCYVLETQNMDIPEIGGQMFPRFLHKICIETLTCHFILNVIKIVLSSD